MKSVFPCIFPPDPHSLNYFLNVFFLCSSIIVLSLHILSIWCTVTLLSWFFLPAVLLSSLYVLLYLYAILDLSVSFPSIMRMQKKVTCTWDDTFPSDVSREETRKINVQVIKKNLKNNGLRFNVCSSVRYGYQHIFFILSIKAIVWRGFRRKFTDYLISDERKISEILWILQNIFVKYKK